MPVVTTKAPKVVDPNATAVQAPGAVAAAPQAPSLPYAQPNQLLNVVKPATPEVTVATQGGNAVLQTAQQGALDAQNKPNETMGLVQQGVQTALKNPLGYDKNAYTQNQLEQYDRNRASAMLANQQANADVSNTGLNLDKAYNYAMQGAQGRSDLENKTTMEQATAEREAMLAAIGAGNSTVQTQSGLDEAAFNRLSTVRSMGEGERSQTQGQSDNVALSNLGFDHTTQLAAQQQGYDLTKLSASFGNDMAKMIASSNLDTQSKSTLMELQDKIDTKQLLTTEDFTKTQNDIDRQLKLAMQTNDANSITALTTLKAQLDQKAQDAQNDFTKTLTQSTQSWQTSERLDEQSFAKQTQAIAIAAAAAEKDKDIDTQKYLQSETAKLQLKMQTQDMGQEEKMAFLNSEIATSKANGDVERQKDLVSFQTGQDLQTMAAQSGIDQAKIQLQGNIQKAISEGDHVAAAAMQETGFTFSAWENQKDRALKEAGIDNQMVMDAIDKGLIDPKAAPDVINKALKNIGVTVSMPDQMTTEKEMAKQFQDTKMQWGMSHPEALVDPNDPSKGLNATGAASFNEFYNTTLYNDQGFGESSYKPIAWSGNSASTNEKAFASNPPGVGSFIRYRGTTYKVTSEVTADQTPSGGGLQQFQAVDTKTGQLHTIKAGNMGE